MKIKKCRPMGNGLQAVGHSNVMIIILVAVFMIIRNSNLGERL